MPQPKVRKKRRRRGAVDAAPAAPRRPSRLLVLAVNVAVFVALVTLLELGARTWFPRDYTAIYSNPELSLHQRPFVRPHDVRGFALNPGYASDGITVDRAGFRSHGDTALAYLERPAILCLGSSTTFGWRVRDEETYSFQLERFLHDKGLEEYAVINAGVPSYTSSQVRLYLDELLERMTPRLVIVNTLWNDVLFSCIRNWYPDILVKQQPPRWQRALLKHSGVYRAFVIRETYDQPKVEARNEPALELYRSNLEKIAKRCQKQGIPILFLPPAISTSHIKEKGIEIANTWISRDFFIATLREYANAMQDVGAKLGVPVVAHRLRMSDALPEEDFIDAIHPSPAGHRILAEDILATLEKLHWLEGS